MNLDLYPSCSLLLPANKLRAWHHSQLHSEIRVPQSSWSTFQWWIQFCQISLVLVLAWPCSSRLWGEFQKKKKQEKSVIQIEGRCRGTGGSYQHLCETGKETWMCESQVGEEDDVRVEWINAGSLPMVPTDTLPSSVPFKICLLGPLYKCWMPQMQHSIFCISHEKSIENTGSCILCCWRS